MPEASRRTKQSQKNVSVDFRRRPEVLLMVQKVKGELYVLDFKGDSSALTHPTWMLQAGKSKVSDLVAPHSMEIIMNTLKIINIGDQKTIIVQLAAAMINALLDIMVQSAEQKVYAIRITLSDLVGSADPTATGSEISTLGLKKELDLKIPPIEIKCKCPEASCLLACTMCFDKESQLCLGVGSYALAFYALWMGTPVAVKIFNKQVEGPNARKKETRIWESFRRELRVLKSLRHPNIIGLYGYDVNSLYLVMEVARNGCLADKIRLNKNREFSNVVWPIHIKVALELVSGLKFLHERGFIHGDLKSFNILLDSNYTVKIADFGTAGTEDDKPADCPLSIAWASPHRLLGQSISQASDIYAVGIMLWELATLQLPYNTFAGSPQKLASQILHAKLRPAIQKHLNGLLSGYRVPTLYVWLMQRVWQPDEADRLSLQEIYLCLLNVRAAWKCAQCGWFNLKEDRSCTACEFDPFSPDQLEHLLRKNDVEDIINVELENKEVDEILSTPKISKNNYDTDSVQPKSSMSVGEMGQGSKGSSVKMNETRTGPDSFHDTVDSLKRGHTNSNNIDVLNTRDFMDDIDFKALLNSNGSPTDDIDMDKFLEEVAKEKIDSNNKNESGISDIYGTNDSKKSVTFEDDILNVLKVSSKRESEIMEKNEKLYPGRSSKQKAEEEPPVNQMAKMSLDKSSSQRYKRNFKKLRLKKNSADKSPNDDSAASNSGTSLPKVPANALNLFRQWQEKRQPSINMNRGIYNSLSPDSPDAVLQGKLDGTPDSKKVHGDCSCDKKTCSKTKCKEDVNKTLSNTGFNKTLSDVVSFEQGAEAQTKDLYEYSKYTKSCIVKDCRKCSFKTNCVLNAHKNLHNYDQSSQKSVISDTEENKGLTLGFDNINETERVGDFYRSKRSESSNEDRMTTGHTGMSVDSSYQEKVEVEADGIVENVWECDLCMGENEADSLECSNCHAQKL